MKRRNKLVFANLILLLALLLASCGATKQSTGHHKPAIVASVDFYGEVARSVAGSHASVTSIIDKPSTDPHDFEATTADAKAIGTADLIVYNGLGYDDWMNRAAQNKLPHAKIIRVGEDVVGKRDGANEHVWYAPETMGNLALAIANRLGKIDPTHQRDYAMNARKYEHSLTPLKKTISQIKQHSAGKPVAVSEPVFDYSLKAMGYRVSNRAFSLAIENGTDPSPTEIAKLQTAIRQRKIAFFVENTQSDSNIVTNMVQLAKKHHVPVVKVTETLPSHSTYRQWMLAEYQQVLKTQK